MGSFKIITPTLEINNEWAYETSHRSKPLLKEQKLDTRGIGFKITKKVRERGRLGLLEINF